jgi:hypothetical protein
MGCLSFTPLELIFLISSSLVWWYLWFVLLFLDFLFFSDVLLLSFIILYFCFYFLIEIRFYKFFKENKPVNLKFISGISFTDKKNMFSLFVNVLSYHFHHMEDMWTWGWKSTSYKRNYNKTRTREKSTIVKF